MNAQKDHMRIRMALLIIILFGFAAHISFATEPPPQNSAHLDGQNTDYLTDTITLTSPKLCWSNVDTLPGNNALWGCGGPGLVLVENEEQKSIIATVFYQPVDLESRRYYLRSLESDDGNLLWHFPEDSDHYFDFTANYSVPLTDYSYEIWFGGRDENADSYLVLLDKADGDTICEWKDFQCDEDYCGHPTSWHLAGGSSQPRAVTVTTRANALMAKKNASTIKSEKVAIWSKNLNTPAISPNNNRDYMYALLTGYFPINENYARLYALELNTHMDEATVIDDSFYYTYENDSAQHCDASPTVLNAPGPYGDFYVIFDVMMSDNEYVSCLLHDVDQDTLILQWNREMPANTDVIASPAYGPIYYNDSTTHPVIWTYANTSSSPLSQIIGIALDDYGGTWDTGEMISRMVIQDDSLPNDEYKMTSVMIIYEQTGTQQPVAVVSMKDIDTSDGYNHYIVATELEVQPTTVRGGDPFNKPIKWKYKQPGADEYYFNAGQFIFKKPEDEVIHQESLIFGQMIGRILCISDDTSSCP